MHPRQDLKSGWDASLLDQLGELTIAVEPDYPERQLNAITTNLRRYGFALLSGIGTDDDRETIAGHLIRLSRSLGELVPQSPRCERIEDIKDFSDVESGDDRGYRSRGEISPHSDPPTLILLHCLRLARSGGENQIVNVASIYRKMCSIDAGLTRLLFEPLPFWEVEGSSDRQHAGPSSKSRPVLALHNGVLSCVLYRPYVEMAAKALGRPLDREQVAALDLFETCSRDPELTLRFGLEPGHTLLLHNRTVLHARTDYEDWPEMERRRHLLRAWIDAPDLLPVAAEHELGDIFDGNLEFND